MEHTKPLVLMLAALTMVMSLVQGRAEERTSPGIAEREGLALCRIVGSPCSLVTVPCGMWRNDANAHDGTVDAFDAVLIPPFGLVAGAFCTCLQICVGTAELLTFQQFESQTYPWELPELTDKEEYLADERKNVARGKAFAREVKEAAKEGALAGAQQALNDGIRQSINPATETAMATAGSSGGASATTAGVSPAMQTPKPRMRHSSCSGTGKCNVCKGKGFLGSNPDNSRLRCRACGGSGSCRACGGSGWAN